MADMKLVKLFIYTGYVGANHETEFELDIEGLTDEEIEKIIEEELDMFLGEEIITDYSIEDI